MSASKHLGAITSLSKDVGSEVVMKKTSASIHHSPKKNMVENRTCKKKNCTNTYKHRKVFVIYLQEIEYNLEVG